VSAWISISIIAMIPLLLRSRKMLAPLRVSSADPSRFAGGYRRYNIQTFTGHASDVGKRSDVIVTGSTGSKLGAHGELASVHGSTSSSVVVTDSFMLTDALGDVRDFEVANFHAQVGDGQLVSVAWVVHGHAKKGTFFLVYNHKTKRSFFNDKTIRRAITFPFPTLYVAALTLMVLPLAVMVPFGLVDIWQVRQFKKSGVQPLLDALEAGAVGMRTLAEPAAPAAIVTQTSPSFARELREVTDLHTAGVLSEAEYEAAKAKLLSS
jgi:hypothetical protein